MLKSLFEYGDYKKYVRERISELPKKGRGEFRKIALTLQMHTTLVSQIFGGAKDLTLEQAGALCDYLTLTELEAEYFVSLVERERSGAPALKRIVDKRLSRLKQRASELGDRLPQDKQLTELEQSIFYSNWDYSAVRLATSIHSLQTPEMIGTALGIPRDRVTEILEFLLQQGLVIRGPKGGFELGPARTHVRSDSPFVTSHHRNWRLKALAQQEPARSQREGPKDLHFTAPMTLSLKDFAAIREQILAMIERATQTATHSASEHLVCLTLDWTRFT